MRCVLWLIFWLFQLPAEAQFGSLYNGFELDNLRIPKLAIRHGGPPRDGIRSIDDPIFVDRETATFLHRNEYVLGVVHNGIAKAYPLRIMDRHEIVNDAFDGVPIVVTYCPLCRSGVSFLREIDGIERHFGVSGLLYNSDVLLYDRESESLWSQILMMAISGSASGTEVDVVPTEQTTWADWRSRFPDTQVLSPETGFNRNYDHRAYVRYENSQDLMFPVLKKSKKFKNKERVLGIRWNGVTKAYPFVLLRRSGMGLIEDDLNGEKVFIFYDEDFDSARMTDANGEALPAHTMYWFAWYAFHPKTTIFELD